MKFMEIDLQIPIYSRDQVKLATWVIFSLFSEKFSLFYKKVGFSLKIISRKQKKQKIM